MSFLESTFLKLLLVLSCAAFPVGALARKCPSTGRAVIGELTPQI